MQIAICKMELKIIETSANHGLSFKWQFERYHNFQFSILNFQFVPGGDAAAWGRPPYGRLPLLAARRALTMGLASRSTLLPSVVMWIW